jgi:hypothetical protein
VIQGSDKTTKRDFVKSRQTPQPTFAVAVLDARKRVEFIAVQGRISFLRADSARAGRTQRNFTTKHTKSTKTGNFSHE